MSRKVVAFPTDEVAPLRRLLSYIEAAAAEGSERRWLEVTPAAEKPAVAAPTFRDMMAFVEEREARRLARARKRLRVVG